MTDLAPMAQGGDAASYDDDGDDAFAPEETANTAVSNSFASGVTLSDAAIEAAIDARDPPDAYEDPADDPFGDGDMESVEYEGRTYRAPKALKGALMRAADYAERSRALASERQALERERVAFSQEAEARQRFARDYAEQDRRHEDLNRRVAAFEEADWRAIAAQDPQRAAELWQAYEATHAEREALREQVIFAEQQRRAMAAHQDAVAAEHCHRVLAEEIDGWSPQAAARLAQFGQSAFGFSEEELGAVVDPRMIKVLHLAMTAHDLQQDAQRARRMSERQRTSPARSLKGHSGRFAAGADTRDFAAFERLADERMRRR